MVKFIFGKSEWEMWDDPLEVFLQRVKKSGFEAAEIHLGSLQESPAEITRPHDAYGLRLTAGFFRWMVVHESGLDDQRENVELAISGEFIFMPA